MSRHPRTHYPAKAIALLVAAVAIAAAIGLLVTGTTSASPAASSASRATRATTIKVGVVTPLSGFEATLGQGLLANVKLWAQQVNASGGLLGKKVQLLIQDDATDPTTANEKAKIVLGQGASVVIGSILDSERTAVEPLVNKAGKIYLFATYYEGGDYYPLSFYTAEVPQQAVQKFVPWMANLHGKKWYFLGSDYSYPHVVNAKALAYLQQLGGTSVGSAYFALGTTDFSSIITKLAAAKPDVVFSNIVGTDAVAFIKQFYNYGLSKSMYLYEPLDQSFVPAIGAAACDGIAVCQGYFQTINTPANYAYVQAYKRTGASVPPVDITTSAYVALQAWAAGVKKAGSTVGSAVAKAMAGLTVKNTPVGSITLRKIDHHCARHMYIAVCKNGIFQVVKDLGIIQPGINQRTGQ